MQQTPAHALQVHPSERWSYLSWRCAVKLEGASASSKANVRLSLLTALCTLVYIIIDGL